MTAEFDPEPVLAETAHRPIALPAGPWLGQQQWLDVLFAHWRVDAAKLSAHVPAPLALELADGAAWLGVVPFQLQGLRVRSLPGVPGATDFLELNVRTYVSHAGVPGVYFFSLDAASVVAVLGARTFFGLPYHRASMRREVRDGWTEYRCVRSKAPAIRFAARYRAEGDVCTATPGTLDHFLVERYCLFTVRRGGVTRVEIQHPPWRLRRARAEIGENGMARPLGLELGTAPDLLHHAAYQPVLTWAAARQPERG